MASQQGSSFGAFLRNLVDIFGDGSAYANESASRSANQKGVGTTTAVATSNASGTLLAANKKRLSAEFVNTDAAITVYICSGGAAATSSHIPLKPGGQYVDNYGFSKWTVIAASGTPNVAVTEYVAP